MQSQIIPLPIVTATEPKLTKTEVKEALVARLLAAEKEACAASRKRLNDEREAIKAILEKLPRSGQFIRFDAHKEYNSSLSRQVYVKPTASVTFDIDIPAALHARINKFDAAEKEHRNKYNHLVWEPTAEKWAKEQVRILLGSAPKTNRTSALLNDKDFVKVVDRFLKKLIKSNDKQAIAV